MQELDLTPQKLRSGQLRTKRLRVWVGLVLVTILGNLVWVGYHYMQVHREQSDLAQLALKHEEVQKVIQELNKESEQLSRWENRLFVMEELGKYPDYDYLTGFLAQHSPEMLALTRLHFNVMDSQSKNQAQKNAKVPASAAMFNINAAPAVGAEEVTPIEMSLEGIARDYQVVADYLKTLKSSGLFRDIALERTWRQALLSEQTVNFKINCTLLPETAFMGYDYANLTKTENL